MGQDTKLIPLTPDVSIIVDAEDYEFLSKFNWRLGAPFASFEGKAAPINRVIMKAPKGVIVDHINGNPLDNRKCNLRFATKSQNAMNSIPRKCSTSKYKGVSWCAMTKTWRARLHHNQKEIWLGRFKTEVEAAIAYNEAAPKYFKEFAKINEIPNV
jgi:hypothetical protein